MENPNWRDSFRYATFVWLAGVIGSPILFILYSFILESSRAGMGAVTLMILIVLYGGIFSIPCWLLLMLSVRLIHLSRLQELYKKVVVFIVASLLTYAMFYFMFGRNSIGLGSEVALPFFYWLCISVGVWYFDFKRTKHGASGLNGPLDEL